MLRSGFQRPNRYNFSEQDMTKLFFVNKVGGKVLKVTVTIPQHIKETLRMIKQLWQIRQDLFN